MAITHKFTSAKPDGVDATKVRASNWNETHAWKYSHRAVAVAGALNAEEIARVTTGAGNLAMTLPLASLSDGEWFIVTKVDSGAGRVDVTAQGADRIKFIGGQSQTVYSLLEQYQTVGLFCDGVNFIFMFGN